MKSIFDTVTRDEIVSRIAHLNNNSKPGWGKMSVGQMVKHCRLCEEYYFGHVPVKRSLLGRIVGRAAIKSILKNDASTIGRNAPTPLPFKVTETVNNLEEEKQQWITCIERYGTYNQPSFVHWFFGRMAKKQLGQFIYKHTDHHLRQFGV